MTDDHDHDHDHDLDLHAWEPPMIEASLADEVIARLRAKPTHRRRGWLLGAGLGAAVAVAALALAPLSGDDSPAALVMRPDVSTRRPPPPPLPPAPHPRDPFVMPDGPPAITTNASPCAAHYDAAIRGLADTVHPDRKRAITELELALKCGYPGARHTLHKVCVDWFEHVTPDDAEVSRLCNDDMAEH